MPVICVTPVKNEAWILDRFLRCATLWADHVVCADQGSTDATREIAARFPKVTVIDNPSPTYDEGARQRLLLDAARRIEGAGPRVILALDADEVLTANWMASPEWENALSAAPGTVLRFRWVNLRPDMETCWIPDDDIAFGYVDDGVEHRGEAIHSTRVPVADDSPELLLREVKVLHYQYTDWERMSSKQRWYQTWETLFGKPKRPVQMYRQYHHMEGPLPIARVRAEWLAGYRDEAIDMTSVTRGGGREYDEDVRRWLAEHGPERFSKLDLWDGEWDGIRDPRSRAERSVHAWLRATQPHCDRPYVRLVQKALTAFGW